MRRWRGLLTSVLVAICAVVALTQAPPRAVAGHDDGGTYCAGPAELAMLEFINDFRAGRGLNPLRMSEPLGSAAEHKSQEMANQGYFRHESPDGVTPRELVAAHGYQHNTAIGENIAAGQERAEAAFAQWRDSEPHRELMLDEDFAAVGIARAHNVESEYDWYWTAEFGGVLAAPAESCDGGAAGTPIATPRPEEGAPVHLTCNGVQRPDGSYDLTCRLR